MANKIFCINYKKTLFIIIALLGICFAWTANSVKLFGKSDNYLLFCNGNSSTCKIVNVKENGLYKYFIRTGESFFTDKLNVNEFLSKYQAKTVFTEKVENGENIYAYSDKIKYVKIIGGEKINLHIFVSENYFVVGSPIIFGSF